MIIKFKYHLLIVSSLAGRFLQLPTVASSTAAHNKDQENHIERQLRGTLLWEDIRLDHHRKLIDAQGTSTSQPLVLGDAQGASTASLIILGDAQGTSTTPPFLLGNNAQGTSTAAPIVLGACPGASTFLGIPFSAAAFDTCTAFQDASVGNIGKCGSPSVAVDGQTNTDPVCLARAGVGGQCHVAFTEPGEWLEYSFYVNKEDHSDKAVFNIILRLAARTRRTVRVVIDNAGKYIVKDLVIQGTGFLNFKDVMWERVTIPNGGPERIFVEFIDGLTNFCNIRVEETTTVLNKTLVIPFHASAQKYISFYELTPQNRSGTCGTGAVDSQPTTDRTCNDRGSNCTIGWTEAGEHIIYLVHNPKLVSTPYTVTLRLASSLGKHPRVMLQVEGYSETYMLQSSGRGMQAFDDATATRVTFPPGPSRLYVTFVDKQVNMCSISIK